MEVRRPKQIPIACRFIPYDQWFLTHIDPTWKIRHLKQIILAKCLSLPFDPRKVAREAAGVRPPSPITFAPDESQRPASPIKFASVLEVRKKRSGGGGGGGVAQGHGLGEDGVEGAGAGAGGGGGSSAGGGAGAGAAAVTATAAAAASTSVVHAAHAPRAEEDGPRAHEDAAPGEEGYEEDDEWDEEDDSDEHELGGGSSRPMGGRVGAGGFGGRVELPGPPVPPLGSIVVPAPQPQPASAVSSPVVKTARKFNPLAKLSGVAAAASTSTSSGAAASTSPAGILTVSQHQQQDDAPQIHTTSFTLVRFSTGQVLEEEFLVSWYDLVPHELVELHASSPIPGLATSSSSTTTTNLLVGFAGAVHLAKALMGPLPLPSLHDPKEKKGGHQQQHQLRIPTHLTLTALPRHNLTLYIQPYWEGWVRALRVVWRSEMPMPLPGAGAARGGVIAASAGGFGVGAGARGVGAAAGVSGGSSIPGPGASRSHTHPQPYDFSDYALGMTNLSSSMGGGMGMWVPDPQVPLFGGAGAGAGAGVYGGRDDGHGYGGRVKTKLEWRERWVVIRDGVINLCKTREVSFCFVLLSFSFVFFLSSFVNAFDFLFC
ncbi:hypothetical protein GALMADRAFT_1210006 [Galerina marginata CBS 339.88]|uniref:Uncharacterized protein n=1 Tax=Galerina marginata (strain CBS 339.88) TaxID=685588 RepID=A0A067S7W1_GALM3|nr:hypothetical protein GALMADRAFT_1210006 [Galerina marginata CBS 339.88]